MNWSDLLPLAEFAYNNAPSETTGISPFFANKGYHPEFSTHPEREVTSLQARHHAVDLKNLHAELKQQVAIAQERYSVSADSRRLPAPEFKVGEKAFVVAAHIRTTRPTRKLAERLLGPFEILAQPGPQSFTLRLLNYLRSVHPVFHVSQLEPDFPNTIPNREQEPPPPVVIDDEEEYEIAAILDSKLDKRFKKCPLRYFVRWLGYENTDQDSDWVPASDLTHSAELVEDFHSLNPSRPGSFAQFQTFLQN
jgi:hypothetical protein